MNIKREYKSLMYCNEINVLKHLSKSRRNAQWMPDIMIPTDVLAVRGFENSLLIVK